MTENQTKTESALIKKVKDIANVMAAAGVGFTDYISLQIRLSAQDRKAAVKYIQFVLTL